MARRCELSGKDVQTGNNVSHANNKNRRRFLPNLHNVHLLSEAMGQSYKFRVSAHALKSVEHRGGLDAYLQAARDSELSLKAKRLKRQIAGFEQSLANSGNGSLDRSVKKLNAELSAVKREVDRYLEQMEADGISS